MENPIPKFNIRITEDHLYDGARELIGKIHPDWLSSKLHYKLFTDGLTNRLIGVYKTGHENEMILIRIYGANTDLFIDRNIECRNMQIMHKHGLAAPIYATFLNGLCYGYTPGIVLDSAMARDDKISKLIAEQMAQMHMLKPKSLSGPNQYTPLKQPKACLFKDLKKFVSLINSALLLELPISKQFEKFCDVDKLRSEVSFLEQTLVSLNSPIVFCHNDLLLKNIIYNQQQNTVNFIDFEYSDYNYQAFDIANHFCELSVTDSFSFDPNLYPDRKFQLKWLQNYLKKWFQLNHLNDDDGDDHDIDQQSGFNVIDKINAESLYHQVNLFAMAALLYWGTWALVQATNSSIDFDYITFACERLDEYFKRKNELK